MRFSLHSCSVCLALSVAMLAMLRGKACGDEPEAVPSFRRDVMAVLSRSGCNSGACHGNLNGKGGLKLSLRGEDPQTDYHTLVRGLEQRRVNLQEPVASLL